MKSKKTEMRKPAATAGAGAGWWPYAAGALAVLIVAFVVYSPAIHGPFLFDDTYLPFAQPRISPALSDWIGVIRPLLMTSYWANYRTSGDDPTGYHVWNILIHCVATFLLFFVVRQLVAWAGVRHDRRNLVAMAAAAIFLLHPVQAESVAYIAGRSESLSVLFLMAAYAVFLYRPEGAIGWGRAVAVIGLFAVAGLTKEHAVVLLPLLLLTDYYWNPGFTLSGVKQNWRLYGLLAVGAVAGGALVLKLVLGLGMSAGFGMKDLTWYQYLFTEFRALLVYLRIFLLPVGLTVDYDFPISHDLLEHGAVAGLVVLLGITAAAWHYRKQYRLASFGWLVFLVLMAPTSSVVPLRDPIAERRMYLSLLGLLLMVAEGLQRLDRKVLVWVLGGVSVAGAGLTWSRAAVWSDPLVFWKATVAEAPNKVRPRFQLAMLYFRQNECLEAVNEFSAAAKLGKPGRDMLVDWGLAYDCLGQAGPAEEKLRQAVQSDPDAHAFSQLAMVYAKQARWPEALAALEKAAALDPYHVPTLVYRAGVRLATGDPAAAVKDYTRALELEQGNQMALQGLAAARQQLGAGR
jgi:protein O-mannosyl-transferase